MVESNRGPVIGPLFLAGDSRDRAWENRVIVEELIRLSGGPISARIVLVSVSSAGSRGPGESARSAFERADVADFRTLELASRDDADRARGVGLVERATLVVIVGGDPRQIVKTLSETKLDAAIRRRLADAMPVAGVGHGAAAMGARLLVDGSTDPDEGPEPEGVAAVVGLGYFPGVIVDPFYDRDDLPDRLLTSLAERPGDRDLGLGLGETSAVRVVEGVLEVIGPGVVAVVDLAPDGGSAHHVLKSGRRFDLGSRTPIEEG